MLLDIGITSCSIPNYLLREPKYQKTVCTHPVKENLELLYEKIKKQIEANEKIESGFADINKAWSSLLWSSSTPVIYSLSSN